MKRILETAIITLGILIALFFGVINIVNDREKSSAVKKHIDYYNYSIQIISNGIHYTIPAHKR